VGQGAHQTPGFLHRALAIWNRGPYPRQG
jgi:hypothetical protein